jgi:phosphate transport system substrate-binding protein
MSNWRTQRRTDLPFAAIRNRSGAFVNPSVAGVTAAASASARQLQRDVRYTIVNAPGAASYPISGFTYILVYKNQRDKAKGKATLNFLRWAMGPDSVMRVRSSTLRCPVQL